MEKTKRISLVTLITALVLTSGILLPLNVRAAQDRGCRLFGSATVTLVCPAGVHTPNPQTTPTPTVAGTNTPSPTPVPQQTDHLLITEVYYDVDDAHGREGANEWVEIHNATGSNVDLAGWSIADVTTQRHLPNVVLPNDCFAVITDEAETVDYWEMPSETAIFALEQSLGNGLGNSGDYLVLLDPTNMIVDAVSWGNNTDAFEPSAIDVAAGHSLARIDIYSDSNTANDWTENDDPTPGAR